MSQSINRAFCYSDFHESQQKQKEMKVWKGSKLATIELTTCFYEFSATTNQRILLTIVLVQSFIFVEKFVDPW